MITQICFAKRLLYVNVNIELMFIIQVVCDIEAT